MQHNVDNMALIIASERYNTDNKTVKTAKTLKLLKL